MFFDTGQFFGGRNAFTCGVLTETYCQYRHYQQENNLFLILNNHL
jgi:hypothetical protein